MIRPFWTDEEIDTLRKLYRNPRIYATEIPKMVGRTYNSVTCKANELGLTKSLQEWPE